MKKRLWWSMFFSAALLVTSVTMFAQGNVAIYNDAAGRAPSAVVTVPAKVPATYSNGAYKNWEGFNSTNDVNRVAMTFSPNFADVAVGPTDVLTVVNRRIARWRNPNATGMTPVGTNESPSSEALLDAWLGNALLQLVCPTNPRTTVSCLIEHATVRYDQMHGRFVVLMTVIDTGLVATGGGQYTLQSNRKATWVMAVSKFATFNTCNTAASSLCGLSDLFIAPTPPSVAAGTIGWNTANWLFYFGDPVSDVYGNINTATVEGVAPGATGATVEGKVLAGNVFDCRPAAQITAPATAATRACYFPTSARLGFDNDNVIVTSAVINSNNIPPDVGPGDQQLSFAGTRVRVFKKEFLYTSRLTNTVPSTAAAGVPGISWPVGLGATQVQPNADSDYVDLYAVQYTAATGVWAAITTAANTANIYAPYTLAPPTTVSTYTRTAFCEPQELRGHPAASFSTGMIAAQNVPANWGAGNNTSNAYIECIQPAGVSFANNAQSTVWPTVPVNSPLTVNTVYIQPVGYVVPNTNGAANTNPLYLGITYYPRLVGQWQLVAGLLVDGLKSGWLETMQTAIVSPFSNPGTVSQLAPRTDATTLPTTLGPNLYVGDNRPQRVIFREGHLYDARAAAAQLLDPNAANPNNDATVAGAQLNSTVMYDIVQALQQGFANTNRNVVFRAQWWNTNAFAPMYEAPANVSLNGIVPADFTFNLLEKLFVATTLPALSWNDPRLPEQTTNYGGLSTAGQVDSAPIALCNGTPTYDPTNGTNMAPVGYAGLYDMRCGTDAYDTQAPYRDPLLGGYATIRPQVYSIGTRNGAAIDPNDGSMWNYGIYARRRFTSVIGPGQWSTYMANYAMSFPNNDPYGNTSPTYTGEAGLTADAEFTKYVQVARIVGIIAAPTASTTVVPSNVAALQTGDSLGNMNTQVTRAEMAKLVMTSLMDETGITNFLNATGGCNNTFADVPAPGCTGNTATNTSGLLSLGAAGAYSEMNKAGTATLTGGGWRYIESMARRGITKGCTGTNDPLSKFCPGDKLTRGQMAVFLIRAKMNNVFVTSLNGCAAGAAVSCFGQTGDGFANFLANTSAYFTDTPQDEFFIYIQKLFELRITNGVNTPIMGADNKVATQGLYGYNDNITRGQVIVFVVRAFFL